MPMAITKIIYISGNETFEMTQIRAAFEEVRETLGLDKDTILFGVPVDCDSALEDIKTSENTHKLRESYSRKPTLPLAQVLPKTKKQKNGLAKS